MFKNLFVYMGKILPDTPLFGAFFFCFVFGNEAFPRAQFGVLVSSPPKRPLPEESVGLHRRRKKASHAKHQQKNPPLHAQPQEQFPKKGNTSPVYMMVLSQDLDKVKQALLNGADVNAPYPENGNTPLHIAALNGYTEIVKLLLAQPYIDKNIKNKEGKTALDLAKERNRTEVFHLLS